MLLKVRVRRVNISLRAIIIFSKIKLLKNLKIETFLDFETPPKIQFSTFFSFYFL